MSNTLLADERCEFLLTRTPPRDQRFIHHLLKHPMGLWSLGSAGESFLVTYETRLKTAQILAETVAGRTPHHHGSRGGAEHLQILPKRGQKLAGGRSMSVRGSEGAGFRLSHTYQCHDEPGGGDRGRMVRSGREDSRRCQQASERCERQRSGSLNGQVVIS